MQMSSKYIRNSINFKHEKDTKIQNVFQRKVNRQVSVQNDNFKKEIFKKLNEGCVLNYLRSEERKESLKTNFSDSCREMKYELCMINKFDENLNSSLSYISEFDLEEDNAEKDDDSFNSSDNDNSVEQIDIFVKNSKKISFDKEDDEHNTKLEKEWNDIKEILFSLTFCANNSATTVTGLFPLNAENY